MDTESKVETPKSEPELKDLIHSLNELAQARIADAKAPVLDKPSFETTPTDATEKKASEDERFAPFKTVKLLDPSTGKYEERATGGLFAHPLSDPDRAKININHFPRGDFDNFSLTRYAYAKQNAEYGIHSSSWMHEVAPWETQYYEAGKNAKVFDPITKAQGDMVSGSNPGRAV